MFVGHYGLSFLAKRLDQNIPLWLLFLAVQLLDVFWAIFVFLGVERVRIVPGFTATNALDLYYMPYTHSFSGSIAWAAGSAMLYQLIIPSWRASILVGAAVFSHWPLDFLVHRPDLTLYNNSAKFGLGLWDYPYLTLGLEAALLFGAMGMYMARSRPVTKRGRFAIPVFGLAMLLMQTGALLGPPPSSDRVVVLTALISYAGLAAVIAWLERGRVVAW